MHWCALRDGEATKYLHRRLCWPYLRTFIPSFEDPGYIECARNDRRKNVFQTLRISQSLLRNQLRLFSIVIVKSEHCNIMLRPIL